MSKAVFWALLMLGGLYPCLVSSSQRIDELEPVIRVQAQRSFLVTEVIFDESEAGLEPYITRMLVSDAFLRIDDGRKEGDFVLYDRRRRQIYSVTHDEKSILHITFRPIEIESPVPLEQSIKRNTDASAPLISGRSTEHIVLSVNGMECQNIISVNGLLEKVNRALQEYLLTLAGEQATNLAKTPTELQTPCMLAKLIFAPTWHLDFGFPIREWDYRGFTRSLKNYREKAAMDPGLLKLPKGYRVFSIAKREK
jgi:hypothetical protein